MIKAVLEVQREELVSTKCLTTFGILATLNVAYQPEKRTLLRNLEELVEAGTASEAWLSENGSDGGLSLIHATEPDPTVLMKGLTKLAQKVLDNHSELGPLDPPHG